MSDDEFSDSDVLQKAKDTLPEITVTDYVFPETTKTAPAIEGQENNNKKTHTDIDPRADEAAELIRQVEYYFSEDNLPHDAHLLGLFKEGEGTVSLNEICGFKNMRKFKPKTWVREVLEGSTLVEVCGGGKRLRRKKPLETAPTVIPKVTRDAAKIVVPVHKPWMTKGMMKKTGFEDGAVEELTEEDKQADDADYHPDKAFTDRITTAVARFGARRKMHQDIRQIFEKFMISSGFRGGQAAFVGGVDENALEEFTKKEKEEMTAHYAVTDEVRDGLAAEGGDGTWEVDFALSAKAFFSSCLPTSFTWHNEEPVKLAAKVLRNFYNYLLLHSVCPEYNDQLNAAIDVCDLAENELPELAKVDQGLPGDFNKTCSILFGGHQITQVVQGDWARGTLNPGWTEHDARMVFKTSIWAYGTAEQQEIFTAQDDTRPAPIRVVGEAEPGPKDFISRCGSKISFDKPMKAKLGLEVVTIEMPDDDILAIYAAAAAKNAVIKPMGKLRCKEWSIPHAAPYDAPKGVRDTRCNIDPEAQYVFLMEVSTLEHCYAGLKFEAEVCKASKGGVVWIDYFEKSWASFYEWVANEKVSVWKTPGEPKGWMKRQNEKVNADGAGKEVGLEVVQEEVEDDMEELDW